MMLGDKLRIQNNDLYGCLILPSAVGIGEYNASMEFKVPRENILVY